MIAMLRDTWWWPWWVSSLIDLTLVFAALVIFRLAGRRAQAGSAGPTAYRHRWSVLCLGWPARADSCRARLT